MVDWWGGTRRRPRKVGREKSRGRNGLCPGGWTYNRNCAFDKGGEKDGEVESIEKDHRRGGTMVGVKETAKKEGQAEWQESRIHLGERGLTNGDSTAAGKKNMPGACVVNLLLIKVRGRRGAMFLNGRDAPLGGKRGKRCSGLMRRKIGRRAEGKVGERELLEHKQVKKNLELNTKKVNELT